ncbi:hypothetical protein [Methylomonas koyamae]|uniref:hypothetical protein n=1 Tax=Methylomonas koyamae TaxID=702114 RepID=UPI00112851D7|nr:hypothetical protein [Methylomonas koyamae]
MLVSLNTTGSMNQYRLLDKAEAIPWQNRFTTPKTQPIGQGFDVQQAALKPDKVKQLLANVDLRNISPHDLGVLGGYLNGNGEISDISATEFALSAFTIDGMDANAPIDMIKFFEDRYTFVDKLIAQGEQGMNDARKFLGDTLHTLYSMDEFIKNMGSGVFIDEKA